MSATRKIVRVFIASPGDLADERSVAKSIVDEFNSIWADTFGYQVELVGWEDAVSMFGRPQSVINKDLEDCELFVGLLWKRWGTPPDTKGPYTSGFEEEYTISVERRSRTGKPELSLFFKHIDDQLLLDPGHDLQKVVGFRQKIIDAKQILYEPFKGVEDFQNKFRRCISSYIKKLKAAEDKVLDAETKTSSPDRALDDKPINKDSILLPEETRNFLSSLLSTDQDSISKDEVARLRLIGQAIGVAGNDNQTIGVHDSNVLFLERNKLNISRLEISGLIDCGLEHFKFSNCPLWHWVSQNGVLSRSVFSIYASFGSKRRGAFEAMALIEEPFSNHPIPRDDTFHRAFADKAETEVRVAALAYLQDCGTSGDLEMIRREIEKGDVQTRGAATVAFIHIALRDGVEPALAALFQLQPETIPTALLKSIFSRCDGVTPEKLLPGLTSRNSGIRLQSVKTLRARASLAENDAEQLLADNDAKIRFEAIQALVDKGRKFTEQEARRILVKPTVRGGFFGLGGDFDGPGNEALDRFRASQLELLPESELSALVLSASIYDNIPYLARASKYFSEYGDELRAHVANGFKKYFEIVLQRMASSGWTADSIEKIRPLEDFLRKKLIRQGLDVIVKKLLVSDLGLLRDTLKAGEVEYSSDDIVFLRAHGDWSDISLIVSALDRVRYASAYRYLTESSHYSEAAQAIYEIGKARLSELLQMKAPAELTWRLVLAATIKNFRNLDGDIIYRLLESENDSVRKAVSLRCVAELPKKRLEEILDRYTAGDHFRYYNVIHWIDFGISLPKDRTSKAVAKIIRRMAE